MAEAARGRSLEADYVSLRQRITLLHDLNNIPANPSEMHAEDLEKAQQIKPSGRKLSIQREKALAAGFAFLAATTGDSRKVIAACVEEKENDEGLIVRLAMNHGSLDDVKKGFINVARILEQVASKGTQCNDEEAQRRLLSEVIRFHQNMILIRLASEHAISRSRKWRENRPKLLDQLLQAVEKDLVSIPAATKADVQEMHLLYRRLEKLTKLQATGYKGRLILIKIVSLCHTSKIRHILRLKKPESSSLDPSVWPKLEAKITKLSKYSAVCEHLLQSAHEISIFRHIEIEVSKYLPSPISQSKFNPSWDPLVTEISNRKPQGAKESLEKIKKQISTAAASTGCSVHAEVQILLHYQEHPSQNLPRIICSNKGACFLCNLFFRAQDQFIIPSTHGRLYQAWGLPIPALQSAKMGNVLKRFSEMIDDALEHELQRPKQSLPPPNESAVFSSVAGCGSVESLATIPSRLSTPSAKNTPPVSAEPYTSRAALANLDRAEHEGAPKITSTSLHVDSTNKKDPANHIAGPKSRDNISKLSISEMHVETDSITCWIRPGQRIWRVLEYDGPELRVCIPRLHLALSYGDAPSVIIPTDQSSSEESLVQDIPQRRYWVGIHWLPDDLFAPSIKNVAAKTSDVESGSEKTYRVYRSGKSDAKVWISHGMDCISLLYTRNDPRTVIKGDES